MKRCTKSLNKKKRTSNNKMTLIMGFKCKDGAILVSDRKVIDLSTNEEKYEIKIHPPVPNVIMYFGAAGYSHLFKQFNRKIPLIVNEKLREYEMLNKQAYTKLGKEYSSIIYEEKEPKEISSTKNKKEVEVEKEKVVDTEELQPIYVYTNENFIDDCKELICQLCTDKAGSSSGDLDVLLILKTDNEARLHHINYLGEEEEVDFFAIGSGAVHIRPFLKDFYSFDKDMEDLILFAFFCIYYVQNMELDKYVGVNDSPDNRIIFHNANIEAGHGKLKINDKDKKIKKILEKVKSFTELKKSILDIKQSTLIESTHSKHFS